MRGLNLPNVVPAARPPSFRFDGISRDIPQCVPSHLRSAVRTARLQGEMVQIIYYAARVIRPVW